MGTKPNQTDRVVKKWNEKPRQRKKESKKKYILYKHMIK